MSKDHEATSITRLTYDCYHSESVPQSTETQQRVKVGYYLEEHGLPQLPPTMLYASSKAISRPRLKVSQASLSSLSIQCLCHCQTMLQNAAVCNAPNLYHRCSVP